MNRSPMPPRRTRLTRSPWPVTAEQVAAYNAKQQERRHAAARNRRASVLSRTPQIRQRKTPKRDQRAPMSESKAREIVYVRSQGWCEVRLPGICLGQGTNWHHRRDRIHGGLWLPSNGLHVCGSPFHGCHGGLTTPPAGQLDDFKHNGWVVPSNRDPADVEVLLPGGWAYLTDSETTIPRGTAA